MIIADLHNDTAYELFYGKKSLKQNDLHIDLKKQSFSKNLLFYAIYMNPDKYGKNPWEYFFNIRDYFFNEIKKNNEETELFKNVSSFLDGNKHNAVITLEGGDLINNTSDIEILYEAGVKAITLTWNNSNKIASSCTDLHDNGLSAFGAEAVAKMEEKHIFADLSHASDKTFFDVMKIARRPALITHSNSRLLCPDKRNITDEMFEALKENKGILGINFYSDFLGRDAGIKDIIKHIEHFLMLGGEDFLSFGSDFDGIDRLPHGLKDFTSYKDIFFLLRHCFSQSITEKIMYKNVLNLLAEA